ncbi:putative protease Do-like protein 14 [Tanacetum coccineum]
MMRQFMRKVSSKDYGLIRLVAIAGSAGVAYQLVQNNNDSSTDRSVRVSVPALLRNTLSSPWILPDIIPNSPIPSLGNPPLSFFSVSSPPAADVNKGAPFKEASESPKPCCGCLGRDTIANAAAKIGPAVVNLSVPKGFHGMTVGKSIGSGTIIDGDGTILTCAHVVVDFQGFTSSSKGKLSCTRPVSVLEMFIVIVLTPVMKWNVFLKSARMRRLDNQVDVTLQDGRSFEGTVVNADLHSDIAIVKINSKTPLPTAKLGCSSILRPGDWVVAVGCPLSLQNTITAGIVSCVDRKSSDLGLGGMRREYLQTDCAINAGNSGGPLVNIDGEVIGVNIMKVLAADGLSFSVPIDSVVQAAFSLVFYQNLILNLGSGLVIVAHPLPNLKSRPDSSLFVMMEIWNRRVVRPWLGLKMLDLNDMIVAQLKEKDVLFPDVTKGVLVPMVSPGSPAERAGFRPGDVVVEFEGKPVGSIKEVIEIMGDKVGRPLHVVVKRSRNTSVTLTVIPEEANPDM